MSRARRPPARSRTAAVVAAIALVTGACASQPPEDDVPLVAQATPLPDASPPVEPDERPSPTTPPSPPSPSPSPSPEPADPLTSTTCEPGPVPDRFDVDRGFYAQGCTVLGHALLAPAEVDPAALVAAAEIVVAMLAERPDLAAVLHDSGVWTTVVGRDMGITEVPEYADLRDDPETDWDERSRGFGGQPAFDDLPASPGSVGEEDVLCLPEDRYFYESIMVHEFAHTLWDAGVVLQDPAMWDRLWTLYEAALADGTWADTYAEETVNEYWAEGVQSYFDANDWSEPPNGIHGHIDTNEELLADDPGLHALVGEVFGDADWRWSC